MRIYFSGIGGFGVGPLAMLAKDMGHSVVGSDKDVSPITTALEASGVSISYTQDGTFLDQQHREQAFDLFVYTSALTKQHPELLFARDHIIRAVKRDELLNQLIADKELKTIAISGTHGKTTTTGMLIWTMNQLGLKAAHSIGTTISFAPSGKFTELDEYFIYEADEFDRNFLHFNPKFSIITNVDYDHADTFPTKEEYQKAFSLFVSQSQRTFMWDEDAKTLDLKESNRVEILDYEKYQNHLFPNLMGVKLPGAHNRMNASLIVEFLHKHFGLSKEDIIRVVNEFPGTSRRFEKIVDGLYSDYAHHPTEIKATIQMANEINQEVIAIYQPHQNVRQHSLLSMWGYGDSFNGAEEVYWLPTFLTREDDNLDVLTPEQLMATLDGNTRRAEKIMDDELEQIIRDHIADGKLVIAMSAGDLDGWIRDKFGTNSQ